MRFVVQGMARSQNVLSLGSDLNPQPAAYKQDLFPVDDNARYGTRSYEGRTESHEQQFCKVTCFIIDKPNTPP